jgi:glycosyltransferase involved in cell wall biosynthesis
MNQTFFSIIIPFKNSKLFIHRCLKSLISQDFSPQQFEILLIDDNSSDGSSDQIKKILANSKISWFLYQNSDLGGPGIARNIGIKSARGELLIFLDSDDQLKHDALSKIFSEYSKKQFDILAFSGEIISKSGINSIFDHQSMKDVSVIEKNILINRILRLEVCDYVIFYCFRKKFIDNTILLFISGIYEDALFKAEAFLKAKTISNIDEVLYVKYEHAGQITSHKNIKLLTHYLELRFLIFKKILENFPFSEASLARDYHYGIRGVISNLIDLIPETINPLKSKDILISFLDQFISNKDIFNDELITYKDKNSNSFFKVFSKKLKSENYPLN